MGRPKTPTALKLVTGNAGKRSLHKAEPDPTYLDDLTPPAWLPPRAKVVWTELAPRLRLAKLLTEVDVDAVAAGCVAIANYRYAVGRVGDSLVKAKFEETAEGAVVEVGEHINPWMLVQSMSFKQMSAIFASFGMTPAARTRVAVNPQADLFGGETNGRYFG